MLCYLLTAFVSPLYAEKQVEEWGYVDKSAWKGICKTGSKQSPIDLDINEAVIVDWSHLEFHNYDARGSIEAENNGHTELIQGFQTWSKRPYITGGNLVGRYYLQQFHFHWDGNDRFGSEHTLDGLHYPLEVHFVHIRQDLNESTAQGIADGIAVVAVQFQLATKGEALFNLEKVTEDTHNLESKSGVPSYTPGSLLPPDTSTFFRYYGSLTTPPCSENVIWTILVQPNYVSEEQLHILRRHLREDGSLLIDNWRKTQPMNGRTLYLNKKKPKLIDSTLDVARIITPVIVFFLIVVVVV
uniref:Carbonic anhydrase n=1 Tax=Haemonchus contortus TaxID=6289 RepID=A0A7I4XTK6_HAECO